MMNRRQSFSGKFLIVAITSLLLLSISNLLSAQGAVDALFIDKNGNVGIGTDKPGATLDVNGKVKAKEFKGDATSLTFNNNGNIMTGDLAISSTGALTLPAGTTAQRQASPKDGALRYNTTAKTVEVFFEGTWFAMDTTPRLGDNVISYNYKDPGVDQKFNVPEGVTKIFVKVWGAGGAGGTQGGWGYGSDGGGGGFSRGVLTVTPGETLTIIVGQGGAVHQTGIGYAGGGAATANNQDNRYCGGGGGRSAVVREKDELVVAGGGGGGGSTRSWLFWGKGNSGGAGGGVAGENGYSQYDEKHSYGGRGGEQNSAGAGGEVNGGPGNGSDGGNIKVNSYGGGGGGGWKGGGSGAYSEKNTMGGGGGGSGHISEKAAFASTRTGTQRQCPLQTDPDYQPGVGIGGQDNQKGGNGLVVIRW